MARRDGPISKACRNVLAYLAAHGLWPRWEMRTIGQDSDCFRCCQIDQQLEPRCLLSGKIDLPHACENLVHKRLIVRTVVAFEKVIADAFFSVNLMQASSLRTDGILPATTKTPK